MARSMTGFGHAVVSKDGRELSIELKSVNHRFLDLALRMPRSLAFLEDTARNTLGTMLARGHVDIFANYRNTRNDSKKVEINMPMLSAYMTAARQAAVQALCPGSDVAALLDKPNNNLAVEYCKAIIELNVKMQSIALPRQGADHGQALSESSHAAFASASALRALWAEGGAAALAPYVPEKALKLYKQAEYDGKYTDFAVMGHCELALLRAACAGQAPFAAVRGVSEGLEHRLENAVRETASLPALLDALTTVRYPRARMRRLAMDAALGYTAQTPALPPYLHLLGARKEALSLPGETALPLSHSLARLARENETCAQMAAAQSRASDLGALCRAKPEPMGGIYRQKIIFLTN